MISAIKRTFKPSNRSLIRELVISDFKLRYQNSVLGYLWSLLRPLLMFGILYVVFTKVVKVGGDIPYYPSYLLLGIVLWTFFIESTTSGMNAITGRGDMIRKVSIPKYTIVISTTMSALVNLLLNMGIVFVFMFFNKVPIRPEIIFAPVFIVELVIFSMACAFLLSALFVKFRDIGHIWEVLLQILFYATPIIYDFWLVPSRFAKIMSLSPLTQTFQDVRWLMITPVTRTTKDVFGSQIGRVIPMLIVISVSIAAVLYFRKRSRNFAEEL